MYTIFWLETSKGREPERPRHRWEDNVRIDLREIDVRRCGLIASGSG
jgi:hypothetical protein